ncbi:MAG TPA: hypothetical protein VNT26_17130 [Candidatus Sulfotelmatobacter sp.]|nr:hypothetical protein [Candidatus Sulfotelmatobacter sp.]
MTASVINVTVDCSTGTVAISMVIRFTPSGVTSTLTGFAQLNAVLEPIPIIATARPGTLCLRFGGRRFVDVTSFPDAVQQQIDSVIQMLFSQRVCLPAPEPVFQTVL